MLNWNLQYMKLANTLGVLKYIHQEENRDKKLRQFFSFIF